MSHNIVRDGDIFYCKKCGKHSEDSLSELCKSALHEEQIENKKIDIEKGKLFINFIGIMLGIITFLGFFILMFIGFEKVAVAIQNLIVISKSALVECPKGGFVRLIKSLFNQQM